MKFLCSIFFNYLRKNIEYTNNEINNKITFVYVNNKINSSFSIY